MGLHYGVLRARPDRTKREDAVSGPHRQIRVVDASGQPWRVAVHAQSSDHNSEVIFWIVNPLVGQPILGSLAAAPSGFRPTLANSSASLDHVSTPGPTASQNRTAVCSWQVARDTGGQENEMAAGLDGTRPANPDSQCSPAGTEG
jgi:hypothetical protein